MSKSRKVLGALLAVVMVISMLSVCAFAVGDTFYEDAKDAAKYTQSWSLGTPISQGGTTYTVQVMLSTNYPVGPVAFRLEGANVTGVVGGSEYYLNPLTTTSDTGMVLMIPDTADTVPAVSVNGHIATVTYTTNNANGVVTIAADPKNAGNPGGSLVAARCTAGTVNASNFGVGQTASVSGQVVTPPAVENADLAVNSGVTGVVVDTTKTFGGTYNGIIYGNLAKDNGESELTSADYTAKFTATNGGSITVIKSIYSGRKPYWGTGTVIEVSNADGTSAGKYIVIIFGDVDGNSKIENADVALVLAESMTPSLPDIQKMASNVYYPTRGSASVIKNHLYNVDNSDIGVVLQQAMQYNAIDFAAVADKHSQYDNYQ